jgi:hypothetical protein
VSDRQLPAAVAVALQAPHVVWFPLVQLDFDSGTVRISGTDMPVEYPAGSGQIWTAARGMGSLEVITETPTSVEGLRFTLAGIPNSAIAEAQQEKVQGRPCTLHMAFIDADGIQVDMAAWKGRMDVMTIKRGKAESTITVTAEHSMADWKRKRELLYNSVSQKRINPADTFFDGIEKSKGTEKVVFSKAARMR